MCALWPKGPPCLEDLATGEDLDGNYGQMQKTFHDIGYLDPQNPDHIMHSFRRIFGEVSLSDREVRTLHGLWSRIDLCRRREKERGGWRGRVERLL